MIRIVHLSDLHLKMNELEDFESFIMKALIKDLKKFNEGKEIDIIAFSGDLIDRGGNSFENGIDEAFQYFECFVIEPIAKELGLSKEKFFFSPGNHDIDKSADEDFEDNGLTEKFKSIESVNDYINAEHLKCSKRVIPFKKFESEYWKDSSNYYEPTKLNSSYKIKFNGYEVGITCFNTSWR